MFKTVHYVFELFKMKLFRILLPTAVYWYNMITKSGFVLVQCLFILIEICIETRVNSNVASNKKQPITEPHIYYFLIGDNIIST